MTKAKIIFIIGVLIIAFSIVLGLIYFLPRKEKTPIMQNIEVSKIESAVKLLDFSKINSEFSFSAKIPKKFEAEYIPQLKAINIYNPSLDGQTNTEKSQIYITIFRADRFLTLHTVEITQQDKIFVSGKEAILYEITKKENTPNFTGQPVWRNFKHRAIDVRNSKDNPSYFYSFAQNPNLSQKIFDEFINSLIFTNPNI